MKTEKELENLAKLFQTMVKLLELSNSADPFQIIDAIDNGIDILEDLIEDTNEESFRNEAKQKLADLKRLRDAVNIA